MEVTVRRLALRNIADSLRISKDCVGYILREISCVQGNVVGVMRVGFSHSGQQVQTCMQLKAVFNAASRLNASRRSFGLVP